MKLLLLSLVALSAVAAAQVEDWGEETGEISSSAGFEESKRICRSLKGRAPPAADRPDAATAASLKGCDSEALYYGIGMKAEPVKARQCAFLEMEAGDSMMFGGRTMLMTIYANGVGAKRDLDLATRLACEIDGAPMESDGRVRHLAGLKTTNWTGGDFHFCDDVTSGFAMGHCAGHQASIEEARRTAELAKLTAGWSEAERQAFERLKTAHQAFAEAHSGGEIDLSGTARAAMQVEAEEELHGYFLKMVQYLGSGRAPRIAPAEFKGVDKTLNYTYRTRLAKIAREGYPGGPTRDGVRDAQRAWLRYRDAFLAFAAVKFRSVPRDSLATWLTRQRITMLATD
jgi:hypothetical protein